jgi:hypothetical protein
MLDRLISTAVAVSLALLVWLYARSRDQEILDNVQLPVQITLAPGQADLYNLEVAGPSQVPVSFAGPPARVRELRGMLQRNELHVDVTLTVPEDRLHEGRYADTVVVEAADVHAPPGVTALVAEGRNRIPVTLHRLVERRLPVHFDHAGEDAAAAAAAVLEPPTVLVRGPQEVLDRARTIPTLPAELPTRRAGTSPKAPAVGRVALVQQLEGRPVRVEPKYVSVRVPAATRKDYPAIEVPVHFLCPANFHLRPEFTGGERSGRITLRLRGPVQDEPPQVYAYVDLTHDKFLSGLNNEPLRLQLPKDFQLMDEAPRTFSFILEKADFIPKGMGGGGAPPLAPQAAP